MKASYQLIHDNGVSLERVDNGKWVVYIKDHPDPFWSGFSEDTADAMVVIAAQQVQIDALREAVLRLAAVLAEGLEMLDSRTKKDYNVSNKTS